MQAIVAAGSALMPGLPTARAAVPEPPYAVLAEQAELNIIGRVVNVHARSVRPDWLAQRTDLTPAQRSRIRDTHYTVTIRVLTVEKGSATLGGSLLVFHGWGASERPTGWAGPRGTLNSPPAIGNRVKVLLKHGGDGWDLFAESGLDVLP